VPDQDGGRAPATAALPRGGGALAWLAVDMRARSLGSRRSTSNVNTQVAMRCSVRSSISTMTRFALAIAADGPLVSALTATCGCAAAANGAGVAARGAAAASSIPSSCTLPSGPNGFANIAR